MTPDQVRQIIREELSHFMRGSRYTFERPIQILDGNDITIGQTIGTRIGSTDSKMGFFGQTPRAQFGAGYLIAPTGGITVDNEARARIVDINNLLGNSTGFGFAAYP